MDYLEVLNQDINYIKTSSDYSTAQQRWVNSMAGLGDAGIILTTAPLGASGTYTQAGIDRLAPTGVNKKSFPIGQVQGIVHADKAGTLYLEESENNSTWNTLASVAVSAGVTTPLPWTTLTKRYYRFKYVNGGTAQGNFVLIQQAAGLAIPNVAITGVPNVQLTGSSLLVGKVQNVTTAGARVQLPAQACKEVTLIGLSGNTGAIYVGGDDVSNAVYGVKLLAEDSITLAVNNVNLICIDSAVNGEGVSYVAI